MTTTLPHFDPSSFADTIARAIQDGIAKALEKTSASIFQKNMWDTADIGKYLGQETTYVRDRVVNLPSFPEPRRIVTTDNRKSSRRWKRAEVEAWFDAQIATADNKPGRPRNRE